MKKKPDPIKGSGFLVCNYGINKRGNKFNKDG